MVLKQPGEAQPYWLYYVNVASVDSIGGKRITAGGGQVLMGPHQVPGGSWIVMGHGPAGRGLCGGGAALTGQRTTSHDVTTAVWMDRPPS
jgi:hypothetical protein